MWTIMYCNNLLSLALTQCLVKTPCFLNTLKKENIHRTAEIAEIGTTGLKM